MSLYKVFQLIVTFLCFPCLFLYQWPGQRRRYKAEDEEKETQLAVRAARRLPPRIGMPLHQSLSSLLQKLPLELRQEIYGYALGGSAIHVWGSAVIGAGGRECWSDADEPFCKCAQLLYLHKGVEKGRVSLWRISLLLTCRQIYTEAIESLYSSNTFCLNVKQGYRNTFPHIVTFALRVRRPVIRSISIRYTLNPEIEELPTTTRIIIVKDLRAIMSMWENVAALGGLRHLVVDFVIERDFSPVSRETVTQLYADREAEILEPLKALPTPLKSFRMRVPWESEEVLTLGGKAYYLE
ncbi:hypothetical protein BU16DRAFT_587215 [Lophium mytilinum]|uniref:DUF7730 domain-containing protein n=1 Tax=Lophium mytilinum TaxID=390894 RepID=A0A6A6RBX8_9PEZI|nr:hypothetical protein BU16DRAFT_587215 [Lophium mytilinum]